MQTSYATVGAVLRQDGKMQVLSIEGRDAPAICYKDLSGECAAGDRVAINVGATAMGLGTGGYDFVICKLVDGSAASNGGTVDEDPDCEGGSGTGCLDTGGGAPCPGTVSKTMKLRYTPMQCEVDCVEDERSPFHGVLEDAVSLDGMPVVCCGLHSQMPLVAAGIRATHPDAKVVYCMTDEAALLLPFSNVARQCIETGLVNLSITCGQAMGGDAEAVSLHSGLCAAHAAFDADVAIVAIGPGIAGTGTALGNGGTAQAEAVNAAAALGARTTAAMRVSFADQRDRHRGASHHFLTAMGRLALASADICYPSELEGTAEWELVLRQLQEAGIPGKHRMIAVETGGEPIDTRGITVKSMGRGFDDDPWFFMAAYAAGMHAGGQIAEFREGGAR